MAQKTICDFCNKNEANKNIRMQEKREVACFGYGFAFPETRWEEIDICDECYKKIFNRDKKNHADEETDKLAEYKKSTVKFFEKIMPIVTIVTENDRFYFMKLVNDILNEEYDDIEDELSRYNRIRDMKENNKLC